MHLHAPYTRSSPRDDTPALPVRFILLITLKTFDENRTGVLCRLYRRRRCFLFPFTRFYCCRPRAPESRRREKLKTFRVNDRFRGTGKRIRRDDKNTKTDGRYNCPAVFGVIRSGARLSDDDQRSQFSQSYTDTVPAAARGANC